MSVFLSPVGGAGAQFFDNNGNPLTGGKLYTYAAGTTTPQATYTSAAGSVFHTNPIVLDAAGRVPGSSEIWLADNQIYKFVLKDSNDVLLATWDQITGVNSNFVNYTTETEVQTATAGQTVFTLTTMSYAPGTGSLTVYVDGVNQYEGDSYLETNSTTVTFTAGLHVGAQVKFTTAVQTTGNATDASVVTYTAPYTGAVQYTVEDKLAQTVSVKDFGAVGDGVTDDTAAIQAAIDSGARSIYLPQGTYLVSDTLRQDTNGYALSVFGDNKYNSILKAAAGMAVPVLWTGNSSGHATYRGVYENFAIQGSSTSGNHGLVIQEGGNSRVRNLRITLCDNAIFAPGVIGISIRDCELGGSTIGINMTALPHGTPSGPNDTSVTAAPIGLRNNINLVDSIWLAGCGQGISVQGGLTRITGCTFQSCGDALTKDIINLTNCNESFDYGGGPIVENCWFEGGVYRSMIYVYHTRAARIYNNFMSGTAANSEAAIIAYNAHQIIIEGNSIRDSFLAPPTDGRTVNAPIYVYTSNTFAYRVRDNYITNTTGVPYFDGETFPKTEKEFWPVAAGAFCGAITAAYTAGSFIIGRTYTIATTGTTDFTLIGAANSTPGTVFVATGIGAGTGTATQNAAVVNSYQFTSLTRVSAGRYRCNTSGKFNIENPTYAMYSLTIIGNIVAFPNVTIQGAGYVEVKFYDAAGAVVDPEAWSLIVYAQPVGQGS